MAKLLRDALKARDKEIPDGKAGKLRLAQHRSDAINQFCIAIVDDVVSQLQTLHDGDIVLAETVELIDSFIN